MSETSKRLSFEEHLAREAKDDAALQEILAGIAAAGKRIAVEITRAGLQGNLGYTGEINVQDEEVRALDLISNDIVADVFSGIGDVCAMASEELEHIHHFAGNESGAYILFHDPLDGSGNVDINGSMGTIFGLHKREKTGSQAETEDCWVKGGDQIAAGYILYGPAVLLVYSCGGSVNAFTLDPVTETFLLTHEKLRFPEGKGSYAVNEANTGKWPQAIQDVVAGFKAGTISDGKRSARYVGALVADFHRTLIQGGIYMYPGEVKKPRGKLRLLYEAAPLGFIAEAAGGKASDGVKAIRELVASELHERVPLFIGAAADVAAVDRRVAEG
ncbi:MAG: class 1 fructose-bisphosphatase [Planctomycetota bacterium]|jgi:fructose-1,6-bisphosphatase I